MYKFKWLTFILLFGVVSGTCLGMNREKKDIVAYILDCENMSKDRNYKRGQRFNLGKDLKDIPAEIVENSCIVAWNQTCEEALEECEELKSKFERLQKELYKKKKFVLLISKALFGGSNQTIELDDYLPKNILKAISNLNVPKKKVKKKKRKKQEKNVLKRIYKASEYLKLVVAEKQERRPPEYYQVKVTVRIDKAYKYLQMTRSAIENKASNWNAIKINKKNLVGSDASDAWEPLEALESTDKKIIKIMNWVDDKISDARRKNWSYPKFKLPVRKIKALLVLLTDKEKCWEKIEKKQKLFSQSGLGSELITIKNQDHVCVNSIEKFVFYLAGFVSGATGKKKKKNIRS
jgi:hypothetical protein